MQCYSVWCSSRRNRGELLQTESIWRRSPRDSLSCGRKAHINPDSTAATSTAQPARSLLNKSASAHEPEQKEYRRDLSMLSRGRWESVGRRTLESKVSVGGDKWVEGKVRVMEGASSYANGHQRLQIGFYFFVLLLNG